MEEEERDMLAGHFGGRLRYCKISPVYTLSTVVGIQPDSAQFPDQCGRAQVRHSPPTGLHWVCSSSEVALQRQGWEDGVLRNGSPALWPVFEPQLPQPESAEDQLAASHPY